MRSHECDCPRFAEFFEPMSTWLSKNSVIPQASSSRSWISSVFDFIWGQVSLFRLPNVSTRSMAVRPATLRSSSRTCSRVPFAAFDSAELALPSLRRTSPAFGPSLVTFRPCVTPSHLVAPHFHKLQSHALWSGSVT